MEQVKVQLPDSLQDAVFTMVRSSVRVAVNEAYTRNQYPAYMNKAEAIKYLHISRPTFNTWEKNGITIPTIEIDGLRRYKRSDLDKFMDQHKLN